MKHIKLKSIIIGFIVGVIFTSCIVSYATYSYFSSNIGYTRNGNSMSVQEALNELYSLKQGTNNSNAVTCTITKPVSLSNKIVYSGQLLNNTVPNNAFDNITATTWDDNRMWQDASENDDGYIGYIFGEETRLYKLEINCATYRIGSNTYSFVIEGLKENGDWEQIGNENIITFTSQESFITKTYYVSSNRTYYGYRIKNNYSVSGNGQRYWAVYAESGFGISELQFYCLK